MPDFAHLGDHIGIFDELIGRVPPGQDEMEPVGLVRLEPGDDLAGVEPAERQRIGKLVEDNDVGPASGNQRFRLFPGSRWLDRKSVV